MDGRIGSVEPVVAQLIGRRELPVAVGVQMPRRTFNVDLLHLAEAFSLWCARRGQSRSVVIRELISSAMESNC